MEGIVTKVHFEKVAAVIIIYLLFTTSKQNTHVELTTSFRAVSAVPFSRFHTVTSFSFELYHFSVALLINFIGRR